MQHRPLIISPEIEAKCKAQAEWADRPENWYHPERSADPPGDSPAYTMILEVGFRVVYARTAAEGRSFRHLTVSIDGKLYPNPMACYTIAKMFGFTGSDGPQAGKDWLVDVNKDEHCVIIAQEVKG